VDDPDPFKLLLKEYGTSKSAKRQCALAYLLKRDAKLEPEDEDLEKLDQRRSKAEIQIKRLATQLKASLPKGRDLTGQIQAEALTQSIQSPPLDDEAYSTWHASLSREPALFPFPIIYETVESLVWSQDSKGHYLVCFQGQGTTHGPFVPNEVRKSPKPFCIWIIAVLNKTSYHVPTRDPLKTPHFFVLDESTHSSAGLPQFRSYNCTRPNNCSTHLQFILSLTIQVDAGD
jgi:hypothetical protein